VDSGAAGGHYHHVALAGGDQGGSVEDGRDPKCARPAGTRSEAELECDLRRCGAHYPIDVVRRDTGVGERTESAEERN